MCSNIPNSGEQMVIYYGFCSTVRDYSSNGNHHSISDMKSADL